MWTSLIAHTLLITTLFSCGGNTSVGVSGNENSTIPFESPCKEPSEDCIWEGRILDSKVSWKSSDFYVNSSGKDVPVFRPSLHSRHNEAVRRVRLFGVKSDTDVTDQAFIIVKSVVGTIISFEVSYVGTASGGTSDNYVWWLTIDLSKKGVFAPFSNVDVENAENSRIVNLQEIFSEKVILSSLLSNSEVKHAVSLRNFTPPSTLYELFANSPEYKERPRIETSDPNYYLTPESLKHFVFERTENGNIIIRVSLYSFASSRISEVKFLEISVPIPDALKEAVKQADALQYGFLGHSSEAIAAGRNSHIILTSRVEASR
jgi:hypothetical protein